LNPGLPGAVLFQHEPQVYVPDLGGPCGDGRVPLHKGEIMNARQVLFFDSMLTPKIINFVYWLALLGVVVSGLVSMFAGYGGLTFARFLTGLVVIVGGAIGARIWCELLIVLFKIHENIRKLAEKA
jgi:hypothetical protein